MGSESEDYEVDELGPSDDNGGGGSSVGFGRVATTWLTTFFVLDMMVMAVSVGLNLCLVAAMAQHPRKSTSPTYMFLLFIFFTAMVDVALLVGYFMVHLGFHAKVAASQLAVFTIRGNSLLQATTVLALLYYTLAATTTSSSAAGGLLRRLREPRFFPVTLLALLLVEVVLVAPSLPRHTGYESLVYGFLFPYLIPLVLAVPAATVIGIRLKRRQRSAPEAPETSSSAEAEGPGEEVRVQAKVALAVSAGYFFFHFLIFVLILLHVIADKAGFQAHLKYPTMVRFVVSPMFVCISLGWHIATPLAPFVLDPDLANNFPGQYVNKRGRQLRKLLRSRASPRTTASPAVPKNIPMGLPPMASRANPSSSSSSGPVSAVVEPTTRNRSFVEDDQATGGTRTRSGIDRSSTVQGIPQGSNEFFNPMSQIEVITSESVL